MTRWCVIGAAGIADRRTIPGILSVPGNSLVAVADKSPEAAERVGKKYGVPYYTDADEMLRDNECDAVYIATPVFCHKENAETALKYSRPTLIEKPLARTELESREICRAFMRAKVPLSVGYMMRYHSLHKKARDFVKRGKIGQVTDIRLQFSCWYPDIPGAWRQSRELGGGGAIMDLGVHCMDLAEYILGDMIDEIKGFTATRTFSYEVEDSAVMIFRTDGGVLGHIDVNFNIPDKASASKLEIYGTEGYIICNDTLAQDEVGTMLYLYAPQGDYDAMQEKAMLKPKKFKARAGNIYAAEIADFEKKLKKSEPDYLNARRAVHIQDLCDSIYKEKNEDIFE